MIAIVVAIALVVGGPLGALTRHRPAQRPSSRGVDSDRIDIQAGWRNMHGG
jgi:hypothetical protein